MKSDTDKPLDGWRLKLYTIIFEADTRLGRLFDQTLIAMILVSVGVVILDSVGSIQQRWGGLFDVLEWGFTLIFTTWSAAIPLLQKDWAISAGEAGMVRVAGISKITQDLGTWRT